jgi:hypothetical protein
VGFFTVEECSGKGFVESDLKNSYEIEEQDMAIKSNPFQKTSQIHYKEKKRLL